MIFEFSPLQLILVTLIFVWSGFVRTGIGFGGAALTLPLLLLVHDQAIYWLPILAIQLIFFTSLTLRTRLHQVDWKFLGRSALFIVPASLVGVFGLIKLPNTLMLIIIYGITLVYSLMWLSNIKIRSHHKWVDNVLLCIGGYFSGSSLTGAPLLFAVFLRNVAIPQMRNTMFVVWFTICVLKMGAFVSFKVELNLLTALIFAPITGFGHFFGLKAHNYIMQNDQLFKQIIGGVLILVCVLGFWRVMGQ